MDYKGCSFLEQGINFEDNKVMDCCISHHGDNGRPLLINNYHGELIDWNLIFEIKEKRINAQKQNTISECRGCYHLGDFVFSNTKKISEFHFSHCKICNAKCIYCSKETSEGTQNYDTYPVIKDLMDKGFYKSGGEATFQGGEPSLMKNFDSLVDLFIENGTKVRIHSSAIKYSPTVSKALSQNKGIVVISLDSGSKKTYKAIKQVDCFDLVTENIKKYSNANTDNIIIKYIIVPGFNDNIEEIDKFFDLMKKLNIKNIALDIELKYAIKYEHKYVSAHIFLLCDYFEKKAQKSNITLLIYSFLSYVLQNRSIKKTCLINIKPLFKLKVNYLKDRTKEIKYER